MKRSLLSIVLALLLSVACLADFNPTPKPVSPTGTRATADLPNDLHLRNTVGTDNSGLCVFTSLEVAARWQNVRELYGYQKFMTTQEGGGWPEKVDRTIEQFAPGFRSYVQHTGGDSEFLEAALATGRMVAVTYDGRDDFYGRRTRIAHMVNLVHLDKDRACIVDNNRPELWVWMTRAEFLDRWSPRRDGWAVVLLRSPPPPYANVPTKIEQSLCTTDACFAEFVERPGVYGIWKNNVYLGEYEKKTGKFKAADGKEGECPISIPEFLKVKGDKNTENLKLNFGIDESRVSKRQAYRWGGKECSRAEAFDALIEDDSGKHHLTVVGDKKLFDKVTKDVESFGVTQSVHLQWFTTDSWQARQFELVAGVNFRKPAKAIRVSSEVGNIPADKYEPEALRKLLKIEFPKIPDPLAPNPNPAPNPVPNPEPNDTPKPVKIDAFAILLILGLIWFLNKKRAA